MGGSDRHLATESNRLNDLLLCTTIPLILWLVNNSTIVEKKSIHPWTSTIIIINMGYYICAWRAGCGWWIFQQSQWIDSSSRTKYLPYKYFYFKSFIVWNPKFLGKSSWEWHTQQYCIYSSFAMDVSGNTINLFLEISTFFACNSHGNVVYTILRKKYLHNTWKKKTAFEIDIKTVFILYP